MNSITKISLALTTTLLCSSATAHTVVSNNASNPTTLDVGLSVSWRSDGVVGDQEYWRIPGALMGGESWPVKSGVEVDEAWLALAHAINDQFYGVLKAGIHAGGEDHGGMELEHVYLGWKGMDALSSLNVEAGRMSAAFSPGIAEHASTRLFSESALALDAFLGRHFHDEGVRVIWRPVNGITSGIEVWRGKGFPATPTNNDGSSDIFARYDWQGDAIGFTAGAWWMQADAELRSDHRYGGEHQHTGLFRPLFNDVRFTGETRIGGLHGKLSWQIADNLSWSAEGEWMRVQADGDLTDGIRFSSIKADYTGGWLQSSVQWKQHRFSVRGEELVLENKLKGPGAPQLANDAALITTGENPHRWTLGWHWQFQDNLALRLEGVQDNSILRDDSRVVVGIVWRERIWPRR